MKEEHVIENKYSIVIHYPEISLGNISLDLLHMLIYNHMPINI